MPFKSKAQRRKFAELLVKGEISPEIYERWNRDTGRAELPERVTPGSKKKPARKKPARKTSGARKRPARKATTKRVTRKKPSSRARGRS